MNVRSGALRADRDTTTDYDPPGVGIDPVVKLYVDFSDDFPRAEGSGFVLKGPHLEHFIFTARHVLLPLGRKPRAIAILTSAGSFQAAAWAVVDGVDNCDDCGVVGTWRSMTLPDPLTPDEAPPGAGDLELHGFKCGGTTQVAVACRGTRAFDLLRYPPLVDSYAGMSGGPLLLGGRAVGIHVRAGTGLCPQSSLLDACIDAADARLGEIVP